MITLIDLSCLSQIKAIDLAAVATTTRIATHSIVPLGGIWDFADNGTYNVVMGPVATRSRFL